MNRRQAFLLQQQLIEQLNDDDFLVKVRNDLCIEFRSISLPELDYVIRVGLVDVESPLSCVVSLGSSKAVPKELTSQSQVKPITEVIELIVTWRNINKQAAEQRRSIKLSSLANQALKS